MILIIRVNPRMKHGTEFDLDIRVMDRTVEEYSKTYKGSFDYTVHSDNVNGKDMNFSEVINHHGYVYDNVSYTLYLDIDNTKGFYSNNEFNYEFVDSVKHNVTLFIRDHNLKLLQ